MHSKHEVDRQRGRRRVGNEGSMLSRTEAPRQDGAEVGANTAFHDMMARKQIADVSTHTPPSFSAASFYFVLVNLYPHSRASHASSARPWCCSGPSCLRVVVFTVVLEYSFYCRM